MQLIKDIKTLLKRFFRGTPKADVNYNNIDMLKMESKYLRYQLANEIRKNKSLELKVRVLNLKN